MLSADHDEMLHVGSGISQDIIVARKYYTVFDKATLRKEGYNNNQLNPPGLIIPSWRLDGKNGGHMFRPDNPRTNARRQMCVYELPVRSELRLDVTPLPWVYEAMKNVAVPLVLTDSIKKADSAVTQGLFAIGAGGLWGWRKADIPGNLLADFEHVTFSGRDVYVALNSDMMGNEVLYKAMGRLAEIVAGRGAHVQFVYLRPTDDGRKTGLDDFFVRGAATADFFSLAEPGLRPLPASAKAGGETDLDLTKALADKFENKLAFDSVSRVWREYDGSVWEPVVEDIMLVRVADALGDILGGCSTSRAFAVMRQLKGKCMRDFAHKQQGLLPLKNGVLDLATRELREHSPEYKFTHLLPYTYDPTATCPKIEAWLMESVRQNRDLYDVLVGFARATLTERADLQIFLEISGPGGTGKTVYLNLLRALVGAHNTVRADIDTLGKRFESARFYRKLLIYLPDQEAYTPKTKMLKNLTGQDPIVYEEKFITHGADFVYTGMVILTANQLLTVPDHTSGWMRRRLPIGFLDKPSVGRDLLSYEIYEPVGEFVEELPGFLNLVLSMPDERMKQVLKNTGSASTREAYLESLLETDIYARWADEYLVYDPDARTQVGTKTGRVDERLFTNLMGFAADSNQSGVSLQNFTKTFIDMARNIWGYPDVKKKIIDGRTYVAGVRIRKSSDDDHLPHFVTRKNWLGETE